MVLSRAMDNEAETLPMALCIEQAMLLTLIGVPFAYVVLRSIYTLVHIVIAAS